MALARFLFRLQPGKLMVPRLSFLAGTSAGILCVFTSIILYMTALRPEGTERRGVVVCGEERLWDYDHSRLGKGVGTLYDVHGQQPDEGHGGVKGPCLKGTTPAARS